jgi:class 3 adenylate cyclase
MTATIDNPLIEPQLTIAELRRQLDERTAQLDDAVARETAAAEILGVINSSPGDLAPVFEAMLEKAMRLGEAVFGMMHTYDGEQFHTAAMRGVPEAYTEYRKRNPPVMSPGTGPARVLEGERVVHIVDLEAEEAYRSPGSVNRALVDLAGARSILTAALHREDTLLGMLTIYRQEVRAFTDKQIALLQNFAAQAVIAMENARLITETREALKQQTATAEVLQVINSSPGDLGPVFNAMLDKALKLCDAAHGVIYGYDGEFALLLAARSERRARQWARGRAPFRPAPLSPLAQLRAERVIHIADVTETEAYRLYPNYRARIDAAEARTSLHVGLHKDDAFLGYIVVYRQEVRPFTEKQIALLQNFAAQAVIAMENARLLDELRARTEEVARWNRELEVRVAAQLAEIERTGKLRRFLAPQLADLIIAQGDESILESHRREIVVVFCDIRGFTAFAERAEPEEVMALLKDYHAALGPIVTCYEGTLDKYGGDGMMVFFNDPLPTPDPARRAINMAVAMREAAQPLLRSWRRHGHDIGFGVGISQGYATLGQIGFAERMDYTAIGTVTNLAARLCAEARNGQILVSRRVAIAVEDSAELEEIGDLSLKGLSQAVAVYNVVAAGAPASTS